MHLLGYTNISDTRTNLYTSSYVSISPSPSSLRPLFQGLFSLAGFSKTGFQKSYHDERLFRAFLPPSVLTLTSDNEYDLGLII